MAAIGFAVSGFGLGISAFSFISDLIIYLVPTLTAEAIRIFEIALFLIGLVVGVAGAYMARRSRS